MASHFVRLSKKNLKGAIRAEAMVSKFYLS